MVCYYWSVGQEKRCWYFLKKTFVLECETESSAFSSPWEKNADFNRASEPILQVQEGLALWFLECSNPKVIIWSLRVPLHLNQSYNLGAADVLGLRILPSLEIYFLSAWPVAWLLLSFGCQESLYRNVLSRYFHITLGFILWIITFSLLLSLSNALIKTFPTQNSYNEYFICSSQTPESLYWLSPSFPLLFNTYLPPKKFFLTVYPITCQELSIVYLWLVIELSVSINQRLI